MLSWIVFTLLAAYTALLLAYLAGWTRHPATKPPEGFVPVTEVAVIVPARNEQRHILSCVQQLLAQDYPESLFQIYIIDDHSEDATADLVRSLGHPRVHCLAPAEGDSRAYKKLALQSGIAHSSGQLIVTSDADCSFGPDWLRTMVYCYETEHPVMITGPVDFSDNGSVVQTLQSIDFMTMQGITVASNQLRMGSMGNGANLAFSRAAFEQVGGYAGTLHLPSGDDFMLMAKMLDAFPGRVLSLKARQAIVSTYPQPDWKSFLNQRIRWASKMGRYPERKLTAALMLVYLFNLSVPVLVVAGFFNLDHWMELALVLLVKIVAEFCFLWKVGGFFGKRRQLFFFPFLQPLHIAYVLSAGFFGMAGSYEWKGRKYTVGNAK